LQVDMKRILYIALAVALPLSAQAEWQQDEKGLAWKNGEQTVWRYSFDLDKGKPFFDPLSIRGTRLTNFRPEDHPWHYGLWFSWKYINEANYWEEDRESGKAQGSTRWSTPQLQTRKDGSARTHSSPLARKAPFSIARRCLGSRKAQSTAAMPGLQLAWPARHSACRW
jgi:Methane oxygenase PmoA